MGNEGILIKVEKELTKNVEGEETMGAKLMIGKTDDAEQYRQYGETHELDWFSADSIDESNCDPIPWNGTSAYDDDVPNSEVVKYMVHVASTRVTNGRQYNSVVETQSIEGDVEEKP